MEIAGEQIIALPRGEVWTALNDPGVLKQCLFGCEYFELVNPQEYRVVMAVSVGPIKSRFNGKLSIADVDSPNGYKLSFEGTGGVAGFGKGTASVRLHLLEGGSTKIVYAVNATVGGRLAQVGARLIDGVARKLSDSFFERFSRAVLPPAHAETLEAHLPASTTVRGPEASGLSDLKSPTIRHAASGARRYTLRGERVMFIAMASAALATVAAAVAVLAASVALHALR